MSTTPAHASVETSGVIPALPGSDDDPGRGAAVRSLFTHLVDDAAVFPPGLAPMADAVPAHLAHLVSGYGDLVGPFLVPASAVEGFMDAVEADASRARMRVAVVADVAAADPLSAALQALSRLASVATVEPVAVEVALTGGADQDAAAQALLPRLATELPSGVHAWVEVQRAPRWDGALSRIAGGGEDVGAKLRTGGTVPEAFPSTAELAAFLRAAVDVEVAFKLTAGLHAAVRGPDATGADHHGFLNVIGALRAALNGAETPEIETVLAETSPARLASAARRMSEADAAVVRAFFASFGCCGVTDPVDDLMDLGLFDVDVAPARTEAR